MVLFFSCGLIVSCTPKNSSNEKQPKNISVTPEVQYQDSQNQPLPVQNNTLITSKSEDESKMACVHSLCGTEYPFKKPSEKNPEKIPNYLKIVTEKNGRNVQLLMGQVIKNEQYLNKLVNATIATKPDAIKFSTEQVGFINAFKYLNNIYFEALEYNKDDKGEYKASFNREKLKQLKPDFSDLELDAVQASAELYYTFITRGSRLSSSLFDIKPFLDALKNTYDSNGALLEEKKSDEEVLQLLSSSMTQMYKELSAVLMYELIPNYDRYLIDRAQAKKTFSDRQKIEFFNNFNRMQTMLELLKNKSVIEAFSKIPLDIKNLQNTVSYNYSRDIGRVFNKKTLIPEVFKKANAACLNSLAQSLADTPTQEENEKTIEMLKKIQDAGNEIIEKSQNQSLSNKLDVIFELPKNQDESISDWNELLINSKLSMSQLISDIEKFKTDEESISAQIFIGLYMRYFYMPDFFEQASSTCKRTTPGSIDDAAIPSNNIFKASWVTVKNLDYGIGIMAHEIGHIASYKYPGLFAKQKDCLKNNYGKDLYLEEDFADLFSSQALLIMKNKGQISDIKNMSCGLSEMKELKPSELNTENKNQYDPHSSQLYRILSVAVSIEQDMNQCYEYLNKYEVKKEVFKNYCRF